MLLERNRHWPSISSFCRQSPKTNGDCRQIRRQSPFSAVCGQGFRRPKSGWDKKNRASLDPAALLCLWRDVMGYSSAEKKQQKNSLPDAARMSGSSICMKTTSMILWSQNDYHFLNRCMRYQSQYEFIVVNGQTTTSAFHKIV